jgi:hypothetical protein
MIRKYLKIVVKIFKHQIYALGVDEMHDILVENHIKSIREEKKNPLLDSGFSYFSQIDEDGITREILKRIGTWEKKGTFLELGVGTGLQNNSLYLLAHGWSGTWVGGQTLDFEIPPNSRLTFIKEWITKENIIEILNKFNVLTGKIDFLSIDLDGNDYYITRRMLEVINPSVVVLEYNGYIPEEVDWSIEYSPEHHWDKSNYFGVSLHLQDKMMKEFEYTLIACSVGGVNAFYVKNEFSASFADCPKDLSQLFIRANPYLYRSRRRVSPKLLLDFCKEREA